MFKFGDKVVIKPEAKPYFGNYTGTDALVVNIISDDVVEIETYDKKKYISHNSYITLYDDYYKQETQIEMDLDFGTADLECKHENKYKNIISANLKFYICKDCGADLGDA